MSCPDWNVLSAHRDDRRGMEPEGWGEAVAHFDGGCQLCRKAALKSDPTLVFRRLAQVPAATMTEAQERVEVDSVRQAVAAMRAASRLEEGTRRGFAGFAARGWKRWSIAAALVLAALTIPGDEPERSARLSADLVEPAPILDGGGDQSGERVYLMGDEELSVMMVFDESFDESFGG